MPSLYSLSLSPSLPLSSAFRRPTSFCLRVLSTTPSPSQHHPPSAAPHSHNHDQPPSLASMSIMRSRRRIQDSPVLPLELVSLSLQLQSFITSTIRQHNLSPRHIRFSAKPADRIIAPETATEKRKKHLGNPRVSPAPQYDTPASAIANVVVRVPSTMTANMYVITEIQRRLEKFRPERVLDFGAGLGVATMAAGRVFREESSDSLSLARSEKEGEVGEKCSVRDAVLVEHSSTMRDMAEQAVKLDDGLKGTRIRHVSTLSDVLEKDGRYDLVLASYSLNEIVRDAIAKPTEYESNTKQGTSVHPTRTFRTQLAEKRLKKTIMKLWDKTAPGGVFAVVEDGTAAGFEVVLFARECIMWAARSDESKASLKRQNMLQRAEGEAQLSEDDDELSADKTLAAKSGAHVIAPCMHSKQCPLLGSVTRHRVCRFIQRFNRPPFLRHNRPMPEGFQDEFFSYIVIQKLHLTEDRTVHDTPPLNEEATRDCSEQAELALSQNGEEEDREPEPWGRLIRAPLMRGKHIALDACTVDGRLERRVVTRRNSGQGYYALARRSRWGDIWPAKPRAKPQPVNF